MPAYTSGSEMIKLMRVMVFGLVVAAIAVSAGCGPSASELAVGDSISARIGACRCTDTASEIVTIVRDGRVFVEHTSGLTRAERACLNDSLRGAEIPAAHAGYRYRVRTWRNPGPPGVRDFILSREPEISACLPGRTTRIVATPERDRYALSVELVDDEPQLDSRERVCILSALEGIPAATGDSRTEVIVTTGPGAPCASTEAETVR